MNLFCKRLCTLTDQNIKVLTPYIIKYFQLLHGSILMCQCDLAATNSPSEPLLLSPDKFLIDKKSLLAGRILVSNLLSLITCNRIRSECRLDKPPARGTDLGRTLCECRVVGKRDGLQVDQGKVGIGLRQNGLCLDLLGLVMRSCWKIIGRRWQPLRRFVRWHHRSGVRQPFYGRRRGGRPVRQRGRRLGGG